MKFIALVFVIVLALAGCAQIAPQAIQFDKENHAAILATATERIEHVSCDVGFVEGLGLTDSLKFPIQKQDELRPLLRAATVSLALSEMEELTKTAGKWKPDEYLKCKILGISYRAGAAGTIEVLKLIPDLAPLLAVIGPK